MSSSEGCSSSHSFVLDLNDAAISASFEINYNVSETLISPINYIKEKTLVPYSMYELEEWTNRHFFQDDTVGLDQICGNLDLFSDDVSKIFCCCLKMQRELHAKSLRVM